MAETTPVGLDISDDLVGTSSILPFTAQAYPSFLTGARSEGVQILEIQGARETKCAGVLYSTSSPLSERNAVDSGRCSPAAVG